MNCVCVVRAWAGMRSWRNWQVSARACTHVPGTRRSWRRAAGRQWAEKGLNVTVSVRADREELIATVKDTFGGKLDILVSDLALSFTNHHYTCLILNYDQFFIKRLTAAVSI
jgi:hypothetical protein